MARSRPGIIAKVPVRDVVGGSGAETSPQGKGRQSWRTRWCQAARAGAIWRVGAIRRNDDGSGPPCGW